MRAAFMRELGSFDRLVTDTIDDPVPGPGRLRIRVTATGLGFVDGLLAAGGYQVKPPVPFIPGNEIAGHVEAVGDGVSGFAVGDPVMATSFGGGLAELCVVDAAVAHLLPPGLSPAIAAALPANLALLKGAALVGVDLRQFGLFEPDLARANLTQVLDWAAAGTLTVPIGARFSLAQAAAAMRATTDRATWGKILVTIDD